MSTNTNNDENDHTVTSHPTPSQPSHSHQQQQQRQEQEEKTTTALSMGTEGEEETVPTTTTVDEPDPFLPSASTRTRTGVPDTRTRSPPPPPTTASPTAPAHRTIDDDHANGNGDDDDGAGIAEGGNGKRRDHPPRPSRQSSDDGGGDGGGRPPRGRGRPLVYNLLVVGKHATGKTGLIKLLLDTSKLALKRHKRRTKSRRRQQQQQKRGGDGDEMAGDGGVTHRGAGGEQSEERSPPLSGRALFASSQPLESHGPPESQQEEEEQEGDVTLIPARAPREAEEEGESGMEDDDDDDDDGDRGDEEERIRRVLAPLAEFASFTSVCPTTAISTVRLPLSIPRTETTTTRAQVRAPSHSDSETVLVNLIDTPGLQSSLGKMDVGGGGGGGGEGEETERIRRIRVALEGVLGVIMDGFKASQSAHLSSVEDQRDHQIHLCLYLLDPEDVLPSYTRDLRRPATTSAVSNIHVSSTSDLARRRIHEAALGPGRHYDDPKGRTSTMDDDGGGDEEHDGGGGFSTSRLSSFDRAVIRTLERYVPVLPIVARADSVTQKRLESVRDAVRRVVSVGVVGVKEVRKDEGGEALVRKEMEVGGVPFAICVPEGYHHGEGVSSSSSGERRRTFEEYMERLKLSGSGLAVERDGEGGSTAGEEEEEGVGEQKEKMEIEMEEGEVIEALINLPLSAVSEPKEGMSRSPSNEDAGVTGEKKEEEEETRMVTPGSVPTEGRGDGDGGAPSSAMDIESLPHSRHSEGKRKESTIHEGLVVGGDPTYFRREDLVRVYRWGTMDVLDPAHTDFVALRRFVFDRSNIERFRTVVSRDHLRAYLDDLVQMPVPDPYLYSTPLGAHPPSMTMTGPPLSTTAPIPSHSSGVPRPHDEGSSRMGYDQPYSRLSHERHSLPHLAPSQDIPLINLVTASTASSSSSSSLVQQKRQGGARAVEGYHAIRPGQEPFPPQQQRQVQYPPHQTQHPSQLQQQQEQQRSNLAIQTGVLKFGSQGILSPEEEVPYSHRAPIKVPPSSSTLPAPPKHRTGRKIAVACNFCRSRKLKCDGGRPQCLQCQRRSVDCEYETVIKKRGLGKTSSKAGGPTIPVKGTSSTPGAGRSTKAEGSSSKSTVLASGGARSRDAPSGSGESTGSSSLHGTSRPLGAIYPTASPHHAGQPSASSYFPQHQPWQAYPAGESRYPASSATVGPMEGGSGDGDPAGTSTAAAAGAAVELTTRGYACQFCKLRKTRCDGATPRCGNCERRNRHCVYPPFPPTPIPEEEEGQGALPTGRITAEEGVGSRPSTSSRRDPPPGPSSVPISGSRSGRMSPLTSAGDRPSGSGVMLPPISSLPLLGEHLPSSSSPTTTGPTASSSATAFWHLQSVKPPPPTLHTQLPSRQPQPFSPVGTSRHGMHTGYSATRGGSSSSGGAGITTITASSEEGSSSTVGYSTRPTGRFPLPPPPLPGSLPSPTGTSTSFPLIGRRSESGESPILSRRSSANEPFWRQGDSPGVATGAEPMRRHESFGEQSRRPGTAESQTLTPVWRDRGSFSSSSTRGGGGSISTAGGSGRKRKASQSDEEIREELRWGYGPGGAPGEAPQMPSPPKRRKVSGDGSSESLSQQESPPGRDPERRPAEYRREWEPPKR